jgi:PEP-CTERM motif
VVANDGSFTYDLPIGKGNNFLTIVAGANEVLDSVSFLVDAGSQGFNQLQQNRVSSVGGLDPVPEPGTLALLGFGMLGTFVLARRRRS